jgi:response regulator RpfG family c-di-GMP phosphodiesterase
MRVFSGIRWKMIAAIAVPTLIVYLGVLGVMFVRLSAAGRARVEREMHERAVGYADRLDEAFERAAAVAKTTAGVLEAAPGLDDEKVLAILRADVVQDEAIYGAAAAFEPAPGADATTPLRSPYVWRGAQAPGGLRSMNIGRDVYDWYGDAKWTWWHKPKGSGAPAWTDPYLDEGAGNVLMVTFSAPFRRAGGADGKGEFGGVATVDIQVSKIRERLGRGIVGGTEFVILTGKGEFVYSPQERDVMSGRTVFDVMNGPGRAGARAAFTAAVRGEAGVEELAAWEGDVPAGWERWREKSWLFYAPIRSTGWVFAAVVAESVALEGVRTGMREAAVALGLTLALIVGCIALVGTVLVRPIERMGAAVRKMASGDLDQRLEVTSRDELGRLAHDVNRMAGDLKKRSEQIAKARANSREAMIFAMAKLAESRDDDTGKHLERICRYTEVLAHEVARGDPSLDEDWVHTVSVTAALHDIGKVGIPDAVLKKPGKLTDEERRRMQTHTTLGGDTLIAVRREWTEDDFLRIAAEVALSHHERWDGTGYPFGLSKEDISLSARIVAVADVYDALTSKRVYKEAMPHEQAVGLIVQDAGKHFDPRVIEAFKRVEGEFRRIAGEGRGGA